VPSPGRTPALIRAVRPRQWVKNLLVFFAPAAAGELHHASVFLHALGAFGLFCLAASGTYLVNDVLDAANDRRHPTKRHRPVASGDLPARTALAVGIPMVLAAVLLAWPLAGWQLVVVVGCYVALTSTYSVWLKREPVIELAAVAGCYVLRAIAGGVATSVPLSNWFLIVASFGSLLVVCGKRLAEFEQLGQRRGDHREVLASYSANFLKAALLLSAAVTVTAYCLWAFDHVGVGHHVGHHPIWFELSIVPFVLGILYVLRPLENGEGDAPEEMAWHDRRLQAIGLVWLVLMIVAVYG